MSIKPMKTMTTKVARPAPLPLSPLARACAEHCPDPETLEAIARQFMDAAAQLRAQGRH